MKRIKIACIACLRLALTVWYGLIRLFVKKQNAVAFISREYDEPSVEFCLLSQELKTRRPDVQQIFCCKRAAKAEMGLNYIKQLHLQMLALAKANVAIVDTYCIPVSMLRHKDLKVIQIWHAITIIKQFGWQTVGKPEGTDETVAKAMRMHRGYDAVIAGSEQMRPILAKTMDQPLDKILALGLPLSDKLLSTDGEAVRSAFLAAHPEAEGKRIISYVPTLRRNTPVPCQELLAAIDPQTECLFVSLHPVDIQTQLEGRPGVIRDSRFSSQDSVFFADVVITDYSGTSAEAVLAKKPLLFYIPDKESYCADCGLNIDPEERFPKITYRDAEAMLKTIRSGDFCDEAQQEVASVLVGSCDGRSTQRIIDLVETGLN